MLVPGNKVKFSLATLLKLQMGKELWTAVVLAILASAKIASERYPDSSSDDPRETIYLLTFVPYPDPRPSLHPSWDGGPNIVPALRLAVEHINNHTDVLNQYKLELINEDGGCNIVSKAVIGFVHRVLERGRRVVGIIGPGCSSSSLAIAPLIVEEELSLISIHVAGSPLLENRTQYFNSFGCLGSSYGFAEAAFALMNKNNWRNISALYDQSRTYFYTTFLAFERDISTEVPGSRIMFSAAVYDFYFPLEAIKDSLTRIVFVFTGPEFARKIMCLAYHEGMLYPMYQWLLASRTFSEVSGSDVDFNYNGNAYFCSKEVMAETALNGNLLINYKLIPFNTSASTVAGISYNEYLEKYEAKVNEYNNNNENPYTNSTFSIWAAPYYDAVWVMALALNNTFGLNIADYRYGNATATDMIQDQLYETEFEGVSGHVSFNQATGNIERIIDVFQIFNSSDEYVAYYNAGHIEKLGKPDFIDDEIEDRLIVVSPYLAAFFAIILILQSALAVILHILTFVYRKYSSIKATSPKLNHLIFLGCYLLIVGALIYSIYKGIMFLDGNIRGALCHTIWSWIFPISYTLIFGTIAARTWRLYRIFAHYLDPGKFISDPALLAFVLILICVDIVIGIAWTSTDPLELRIRPRIIIVNGVRKRFLERTCSCDYYYYWLVIILGYKLLLLLAVIILSLLTRSIRNRNFATSSLRVFVYLLGSVFTFGVTLYYLMLFLNVSIYADYVVLCVLLNAIVCMVVALVLFPPFLPLLKEKIGKFHPRMLTHTSTKT